MKRKIIVTTSIVEVVIVKGCYGGMNWSTRVDNLHLESIGFKGHEAFFGYIESDTL
jgi:hypothetical protein